MSKDISFRTITKETFEDIKKYRDSYFEGYYKNYEIFSEIYLDYADNYIRANCENLDDDSYYYIDKSKKDELLKLSKEKYRNEEGYNNKVVEDFIEYLQNLKLQENEYFTCNLDS